ncbi:potassium channel family protein [Arthrobacter sp. AL12]|uniref:potassium channel family protein n=1 Tax=Arthrobacter sp. AL12 TaxID=3042241 RepID=UPI00249C6120|nr:potassium channel family protein [Arthrobacter sp. AL12]MDI3212477.1 potassium channel family protein [Arthrobacter sp. AL12]
MTQQLWRRHMEWPLLLASVAFLVAYSVQVIGNLREDAGWIEMVVWATWVLFAVDYIVNLALAPLRGRWFIRNLHELLILALPILRPLRLLRLVTLLKVVHRAAGSALRGRILTYVLGAAALLTYAGALAVLDAESNVEGANISTFGDAMWWALTTITTVGYGDHYPVTMLGRFVAAGLMVGGIAVLGVVTASVASWLVEQVTRHTAAEVEVVEAPMRVELVRLSEQVERLTALLERQG